MTQVRLLTEVSKRRCGYMLVVDGKSRVRRTRAGQGQEAKGKEEEGVFPTCCVIVAGRTDYGFSFGGLNSVVRRSLGISAERMRYLTNLVGHKLVSS